MAENFFAMIDRVKRNIIKNTKNPQAMLDALDLALVRGREDFNADPVGMTLDSANFGGVGAGLAGLAGITAFHGTPYKFDKFSMDKIGTGEGAQAYGNGLYFADNPEVAMGYRSALSSFNLEDGPAKGMATLIASKGDKGESMARRMFADLGDNLDTEIQRAKQAIDQSSSLYKVDIPDESVAKMLPWDKPVPDELINAIREPIIKRFESGPTNTSGEQLYKEMVFNFRMEGSKTPEADASKYLKELGIPGIRYLDGGSRGAGTGSMNTVLFDDSLVKILERNGKPLQGLQGIK